MSEAAADLAPGTMYGRYRIRQRMAAGGMATVYVAQLEGAAGFGKLVALKRIHPHLAHEEEFVRMFLDEARLTSRIDHANVCAVTDFGQAAGTYFLAMELLHGESFSSVVRTSAKRNVTPTWRARLFAKVLVDVCEGLHAAHELVDDHGASMSVVHRDVSPQNLFVTHDGVGKVLDFGIAKARHRLQDETAGVIKGKYAYMSPEQARGGSVDRRTDVWALGVVAWETLTGKRLFRRETEMETLFAVASDEVPPPSRHAPELEAFDAAVLRCLQRDPEARFQTARELGRALTSAAASLGGIPSQSDVADRMVELFPDAATKRLRLEAMAPGAPIGPAPAPTLVPVAAQSEPEERAPPPASRLWVVALALFAILGAGITWVATDGTPTVLERTPPRSAPLDARVEADAAETTPDAGADLEDAATPPDAHAAPARRTTSRITPEVMVAVEPETAPTTPSLEPPATSPAPAAVGEGSFRIRGQVRIDVLRIDGISRNPIATHRLDAGEHDIVVVGSDGVERARRITVVPDERVTLDVPWW